MTAEEAVSLKFLLNSESMDFQNDLKYQTLKKCIKDNQARNLIQKCF